MTPIEHLEHLRIDYIKEIDLFFSENDIKSIRFEPVENNLDIDPAELTSDGTLTLIDEFGNDSDEKINTLGIEFVAFILTLIHNRNYDVI